MEAELLQIRKKLTSITDGLRDDYDYGTPVCNIHSAVGYVDELVDDALEEAKDLIKELDDAEEYVEQLRNELIALPDIYDMFNTISTELNKLDVRYLSIDDGLIFDGVMYLLSEFTNDEQEMYQKLKAQRDLTEKAQSQTDIT